MFVYDIVRETKLDISTKININNNSSQFCLYQMSPKYQRVMRMELLKKEILFNESHAQFYTAPFATL